MKLKDIMEVSQNEKLLAEYTKIRDDLVKRFGVNLYSLRGHLRRYRQVSSYAKNTHTGKLKDGVELSELELSMVCDSGFSHFGGSSFIGSDGTFTVVIYTD